MEEFEIFDDILFNEDLLDPNMNIFEEEDFEIMYDNDFNFDEEE